MGLPGIFEVFQLAIGPSTVLTTGALRIGQAFREVLYTSPYRTNYRILIELSGNFSRFGRENASDQAVIAGLGGYTLETGSHSLKSLYRQIKENGSFPFYNDVWPFNPESDLIFADGFSQDRDTIRFHLISRTGQPVFQAEYHASGSGVIKGPGIPDSVQIPGEHSPETLSEIRVAMENLKITPIEYAIGKECNRYQITTGLLSKRMLFTWKLMVSNIDMALRANDSAGGKTGSIAAGMYRKQMAQALSNPTASGEHARSGIYAAALAEEILGRKKIITAPTCEGSAIVPALLKQIQEKFLFTDERMGEALIICGLFGSLLLNRLNKSGKLADLNTQIACSAAMACAGAAHLLGGSLDQVEKAATMALILTSKSPGAYSPPDAGTFILLNTLVAQSLPNLVDLSGIQGEGLVPAFDKALDDLFARD